MTNGTNVWHKAATFDLSQCIGRIFLRFVPYNVKSYSSAHNGCLDA